MTVTLVGAQTPKGPYPGAVNAGDLDAVETACDASNGNAFALTGHEILVLRNTDTAPHTVTISSTADSRGRTLDITAYSIAAGKTSFFSFLSGQEGWKQVDGTAHILASDVSVKMHVLRVQR